MAFRLALVLLALGACGGAGCGTTPAHTRSHTYAGRANAFIECPYTALGHATPANWGPDTWTFFSSYP